VIAVEVLVDLRAKLFDTGSVVRHGAKLAHPKFGRKRPQMTAIQPNYEGEKVSAISAPPNTRSRS
jgi:hypothetical protein